MTYKLHQPSTIKEILNRFGFKFSKGLGQNFLIDDNILNSIIEGSEVDKDDYVLEVGPGFGTLTERLVDRAAKVYSVEIDQRLIEVLAYTVGSRDNFELINSDILKVDLNELERKGQKFKVIANLPYYITTPIIEHLFNYRDIIDTITVMVQKEVTDRMVAEPSSKNYSALSLFVKNNADAKIICKVSKNVFMPAPKVDSAVVRMDLKDLDESVDQDLLTRLIRAGFSKRRKTILNSLTSSNINISKDRLREILGELGLKENLRAENLSLDDYKELARAIKKNV
ncbi:MAG: 16S rRNA (adenine(1518)-N(6)/adenine(1519)-N(6))-dimethyltransferase RsmA [Finegoldia sp.]|nr:16S rRNA (adenine(1518)-N(6)/adenine(1519)-N(6))-dimethyltransferase RsmA [Finegoldia sp.]